MDLGNILLNQRKKKGLSQEEVADKLNVSRQTISKWETNQSQPDFDKILPLCDLYGISTDELFRGKVEETQNNHKDSQITDMQENTKKRAKWIGFGIFQYFIGVAIFLIAVPFLKIDPVLSVAIFILVCGIGTFSIIYANIVYKKKHAPREEKRSNILRNVIGIITLVFTCLYFTISFATMAWHITWILWIINVLVIQIAKLIFALRGENNEK